MAFNGIAFGLPFTMNSVEGTEASLFVAAAASRSTWRRAMIAVGAAAVTLVPVGVLIWVLFRFVGATYLDYAISATIFLLGLREVREGLSERPASGGALDAGATEGIGLGPASASSVKEFQRRHGLQATGIVDHRTRAAIRAARAEAGYQGVDPYVFGVDPVDVELVRRLQHRHGLAVTGDIDAATRGALRVAQQRGLLDGLDADAVERFQRDNGLPATGDVDEQTAIAVAAVRAEGATTVDSGDGPGVGLDAAAALAQLDPAVPATVRRLQHTLGLGADGIVDDETRGAIRALRARLQPDPADPGSIAAEQRRLGLPSTGVLDSATRQALAAERDRHDGDGWRHLVVPSDHGAVPDPADTDRVRDFQHRYGLEPDGVIDDRTQRAMRFAREYFCDVDPVDELSVRRFQRHHGLADDGVIGERTQVALATVRAERFPADPKQRKQRYGDIVAGDGVGPRLHVDIADPEAVRDFQQDHHLPADGVVGPRTREALAVALHQRVDGSPLAGSHDATGQRSGGAVARLRAILGDAWPAYVGVVLETSEALLYSFAVASSSLALFPAIIGAGVGFAWPWSVLPAVRRLTDRIAEWKQETGIGIILVGVAVTFGILHAIGVFH